MTLKDVFTPSDEKYLDKILKESNRYCFPSKKEILEFLENTDASGFEEEVLDDLIIRLDGNRLEFEQC